MWRREKSVSNSKVQSNIWIDGHSGILWKEIKSAQESCEGGGGRQCYADVIKEVLPASIAVRKLEHI